MDIENDAVVDEAELKEGGLDIVDDEDTVDLDDKLPVDDIVDPLLALDEDEEKEEEEDDDKADMEAVMWQDYDER